MFKANKVIDEVAKLAGNAAGSLLELRKEIEQLVHDKIEQALEFANVVKREEFETLRQLTEKALAENADLKAELDAIKINN